MKENQKHLTAFEAHLVLKNYSKATLKAYGSSLQQFLKYRTKQGATGLFTQDDARAYILFRYSKGLKWQTINGDYSALYMFYKQVLKLDWDV